MSICVYSNIRTLIRELRRLLPNQKFVEASNGTDDNLKSSEIVIADFDLLAPCLHNLPNTKWVQGTWAGVDKLLPVIRNNSHSFPFQITRFSGHRFGQMMSEYVIGSIFNHERNLIAVHQNQRAKTWNKDGKIQDYRCISDLTVAILGVGNIGTWVARSLNLLGSTVLGYGRNSKLKNADDKNFISNYFTKSNLSDLLRQSDYIINILPHTPETAGLLNNEILKVCADRQPVLVNVGRGSLIDEKDLIHALNNKWLSAAILDVFSVEPLPSESPLWITPNVTITPHVAAESKASHIAEQFVTNLKLYRKKEPLQHVVSFENFY